MLLENDAFYKELGDRVKTQRLKKKVGQQELADHLNLTRTSVANFERGRHKPSVYQLIQIANFLDIDYTRLIPFVFERNKPVSGDINIDKVVIDQGDLDAPTKNAVLGFITNINKE